MTKGNGSTQRFLRRYGAVVVTLCLLTVVFVHGAIRRTPPATADDYHRRVRDAALSIPLKIGTWVGKDLPVPRGAVTLLHPNVVMARHYDDTASMRQLTFQVVQCRDARDMLGHYPPICYPGQGWELRSTALRDCKAGARLLQATEYEFSSQTLDRPSRLVVENMILMPDPVRCPDMETVEKAAQDQKRRFFGAAQLQMIFDMSIPQAERFALFQAFLEGNRRLVDEICSGETQ